MIEHAGLTLINGIFVSGSCPGSESKSGFDVRDRGLAYGDGLFETMRVVLDQAQQTAHIPLLKWHLERFKLGVLRLKLGVAPDLITRFKRDVEQLLSHLSENRLPSSPKNVLCKVIVTRGQGGRGYLPPERSECQTICQILALPNYPDEYRKEGVSVRICQHRLAHQPALAGIKHLNRLDQVLASQELKGEQEGLLFDQNNQLVEGIKSNVLVFEGEHILTPCLDNCGVQGTLRQYLLSQGRALGFQIEETTMDKNRFEQADGLAMMNSVFGLWPVSFVDGKAVKMNTFHAMIVENIQQFLQLHLGY